MTRTIYLYSEPLFKVDDFQGRRRVFHTMCPYVTLHTEVNTI